MTSPMTWITSGSKTPCYLRKSFRLERPVAGASARVSGLGQFNFYLNGERVGDSVLDPGWTDYNKLVQFAEYDVTAYLRPGDNALGLELGNGWYIWDDSFGYGFRFPAFMPPER